MIAKYSPKKEVTILDQINTKESEYLAKMVTNLDQVFQKNVMPRNK